METLTKIPWEAQQCFNKGMGKQFPEKNFCAVMVHVEACGLHAFFYMLFILVLPTKRKTILRCINVRIPHQYCRNAWYIQLRAI